MHWQGSQVWSCTKVQQIKQMIPSGTNHYSTRTGSLSNHIFKIFYPTFCDINASLFYGMASITVLSLSYPKHAVQDSKRPQYKLSK